MMKWIPGKKPEKNSIKKTGRIRQLYLIPKFTQNLIPLFIE